MWVLWAVDEADRVSADIDGGQGEAMVRSVAGSWSVIISLIGVDSLVKTSYASTSSFREILSASAI